MFIQNAWLWAQIAAIAFFGSLAVTGFMCAAGLGDASDERSAHKGVIPTGGGVGIIAGLGLALCMLHYLFPGFAPAKGFAPAIALVFAVGLLGLSDDALTLGPKLKFGIMILICGAAVWSIGPPETLPFFGRPINLHPVIGFGGALLWIFVVMNAVNFMDGANGMMGLALAIANFALFGVGLIVKSPTTVLLSGLALMAVLGFLPYNLRAKANVFSGDVGSLSLSFLFAITVLFLIAETPSKTYHLIGPLLILPFLVDVFLTLVLRARNRDKLLISHNKHLYQRLIRSGHTHLTVSWFYALAAMICANIAVIGVANNWFEGAEIFTLLVGASSMIYVLISRSLSNPRNHKP